MFEPCGFDCQWQDCDNCMYDKAMQLSKKILKSDEGCSMCKNRIRCDGYWDCKIGEENCDYDIDWNAVCKEYEMDDK